MAWPLIILAVPSVLVGLWGSPFGGDGFGRFLEGPDFHEEMNTTLAVGSSVVALAGIGLAYAMYLARAISPVRIAAAFGPLYRLPLNKYYLDDLYQAFIQRVVLGISSFLAWVIDPRIIDGVVNGIGRIAVAISAALRPIQTGRVQSYALFVFGGLALISLVAMLALRP
jgi:NADH-quinone oxidoreductase subunit L